MAYRDGIELRREHVRRLEEELAKLDDDLAAIAGPTREGARWERLLGGPRVVERRVELRGERSDEELAAICERVYRVNGRATREGGVWIWRGEPDPRPRRVEVRAERSAGRTRLTVRDGTRVYRAYFAPLSALAVNLFLLQGRPFDPVRSLLVLSMFGLCMYTWRQVARVARRKVLDARELARALEVETSSAGGVQVELEQEDEELEITPELARASR